MSEKLGPIEMPDEANVPPGHDPPWWLHASLFALVLLVVLAGGMAQYLLISMSEPGQGGSVPVDGPSVQNSRPHTP